MSTVSNTKTATRNFEIPQTALPLLFVGIVLAVYAPVVFTTYGITDDYLYLFRGLSLEGSDYGFLTLGRPLVSVFDNFAFGLAGTIPALGFIRLVGVVFAGLLAWLLYQLLSFIHPLRTHRFWIALAIVFLPTFQAWLPTAMEYSYPLVASFALSAAIIADLAFENIQTRWGLTAPAVILLLIAMMTYQPSAMFFFVGVFINLFRRHYPVRVFLARYAVHLAVFLVAGILTFAVLKTAGGYSDPRAMLVSNIEKKVNWFITQAMVNALSLYVVPGSRLLAVGIGLFILVGLWLYFSGQWEKSSDWKYRAAAYLACLSLLSISYASNLIVAENWASYRTLGAMATLVLLYFFLAIRGYLRILWEVNRPLAKRVLVITPIAISLLAAMSSISNTLNYFVVPQAVEMRYLKGELARLYSTDTPPTRITVILPRWQETGDQAAPAWLNDEFGAPSTSIPIAAEAMTRLLLAELGQDPLEVKIETIPELEIPARDNPIINMRLIRYLGLRE